MTTKTKPKATKRDKRTEFKPESFDDPADKDRDEVNSSLESLKAEREKWEKKFKSVDGWRKKLQAAQAKVARAKAEFEDADASRKQAKAAVESAIARELELVAKFVHGEQLLPLDDTDQPAAAQSSAPVGSDHAANTPIAALLQKNIKKTVGAEVFDKAKESGSPIGMTEKQLEILEAADIKTIGDLEKRMRENEWWHRDLKGIGEDKINRLSDTLLAYRQVFPVPAEPEPEAARGEPTIIRGDGSVVEGGVDQMVDEINEMFEAERTEQSA